tara:strand:+ start:1491 stop:2390 length:900 start_codon:yes stop_codon:yes gene_type:complete
LHHTKKLKLYKNLGPKPSLYLGADSIYAIHLNRHKLRLENLIDLKEEHGLNINIIEAIDNKDVIPLSKEFITQNLSNTFFCAAGFCSVGVVCCALSHRKAYKAFLDSGDEVGLFLEDDAMITLDVHKYDFNEIRKELDSIDWGVCWLGKWAPTMAHALADKLTDNLYEHKHFVRHNQAAHAYLLNRKSAQWYYDATEKIKFPADIRLEVSPFKQVSIGHSVFIQKHRESILGNKAINEDEWWHSTMDDVPISGKLGNGIRKYHLNSTSKYMPILDSYRKNISLKGEELIGVEFKLNTYL